MKTMIRYWFWRLRSWINSPKGWGDFGEYSALCANRARGILAARSRRLNEVARKKYGEGALTSNGVPDHLSVMPMVADPACADAHAPLNCPDCSGVADQKSGGA